MKQLIEDYERRLKSAEKMLKQKDYTSIKQAERLKVKASCYRTFLSELKRQCNIPIVTKRLNWIVEEMDKAKPFSQSYNNLNKRHSRLLEAKKILYKEGLWL